MNEEELLSLKAASLERRIIADLDDRKRYLTPQAANDSVAGALWWGFAVLIQDRPLFLVLGTLALAWTLARMIARALGFDFL